MALLLLRLFFLALPAVASAGPAEIASCGAKGRISYGSPVGRGVASWEEFGLCWEAARRHFGNASRNRENQTVADRYQIFSLALENAKGRLSGSPGKYSLDAEDLASDGSSKAIGTLPYMITLDFPAASRCPDFELESLDIELSNRHGGERPYLAFSVSGCSRSASRLVHSRIQALAWGNPALHFINLSASTLISLEPSRKAKSALCTGAASFEETLLDRSNVSYFGSLDLTIGEVDGKSQDGVRAVSSTFVVLDPSRFLQGYEAHQSYGMTANGAFDPGQGEGVWAEDFVHFEDCQVQYLGDLQLGTIHAVNTTFTPWTAESSPIWKSSDPPYVSIYRSDMTAPRAFGSNLTDCKLEYAWGASLTQSTFQRCSLYWLSSQVPVPTAWDHHKWGDLIIDLRTRDISNAFPQLLSESLLCLRPALRMGNRTIEAEKLMVSNGTETPGTQIAYASSSACSFHPKLDIVI